MLFNSIPFLFLFLPVTYLVYWQLRKKEQRYGWLALSGYVFYSFWNYKFCALMLFSTVVSFTAGLALEAARTPGRRRLYLVLPIAVDLLLLGFFKYANFTFSTVNAVGEWLGLGARLPALDIILPIGISFYTFHTISYIVDVYRGLIKPTRSFLEFACYVSLFSQLVAGPIVRFRQVEADLEHLDQADRAASLNRGWSFFVIGMVKKVLIADTIAAQINPALAHHQDLGTLGAWLCMLGYSYQLYFDFSGYSDMAVGLGQLFGIRLPQNFNSPYKALDIGDFWRRWHISLSSCLRDYLYIPFGGSRAGEWRTHRNMMLTMLIGGLWHGANWTFVVWGAYHGAWLAIHRIYQVPWARLPASVRRAATFLIVVVGWVFFRADTIGMALDLLHRMFGGISGALMPWSASLAAMLGLAAVIAHRFPNTFELRHQWRPLATVGLAIAFVASLAVVYGGQPSPFLYFQF